MKTFNIYEAKTNFSKLLDLVAAGEEVVIARNGKPVADLTPHKPKKNTIKFGVAAGKIRYKDEDLVGIDPEIQEMFYGKDWDKQ
ncbi:MAG TPA: type II toxin-antitoxin system Phd/YefM family antitoxin [Candidatus Saccharimonadales bacterium]|nr:type II toxin-antitoxin system Phd/YefM family antitoxin [Candidatus Saccharimonadales bacterium]